MGTMKRIRWALAPLLVLAISTSLRAQEKHPGNAAADSAALPAFRVQVVISEYDGANKVASLPYIVPIATTLPGEKQMAFGSVRVGLRVPIPASTKTGENSIQYMDVGSNVDVRVRPVDAERYSLELTIERSWLYSRYRDKDGNVQGRAWVQGDPLPESAPLNHHFRANIEFVLRDGRNAETTAATDPITGHVFKVDAQLTVLK